MRMTDVSEIKKAIKPKADSTLNNMRKADLIEYIRCLENNYNASVWFNENQARYIEQLGFPIDPASLRPKGEWIIEWEYERNYATGEVDETPHSLCPFCGKIDEYGVANNDPYWAKPHNFCPNCGADMRGEEWHNLE